MNSLRKLVLSAFVKEAKTVGLQDMQTTEQPVVNTTPEKVALTDDQVRSLRTSYGLPEGNIPQFSEPLPGTSSPRNKRVPNTRPYVARPGGLGTLFSVGTTAYFGNQIPQDIRAVASSKADLVDRIGAGSNLGLAGFFGVNDLIDLGLLTRALPTTGRAAAASAYMRPALARAGRVMLPVMPAVCALSVGQERGEDIANQYTADINKGKTSLSPWAYKAYNTFLPTETGTKRERKALEWEYPVNADRGLIGNSDNIIRNIEDIPNRIPLQDSLLELTRNRRAQYLSAAGDKQLARDANTLSPNGVALNKVLQHTAGPLLGQSVNMSAGPAAWLGMYQNPEAREKWLRQKAEDEGKDMEKYDRYQQTLKDSRNAAMFLPF